MATSRLEKIGNIFTRVQGLLKSGAMKYEDRPLFFDIYKAFPPLKEPKFGQDPDTSIRIKQIFYAEDVERASRDESRTLYNINESTRGKQAEFSAPKKQQEFKPEESGAKESQQKIFDFQQLTDLKE